MQVIVDMERFKQSFQEYLQEAEHYLMLSKGLCESLLVAKKNIADHAVKLKNRKTRAVLDSASAARSRLRSKLQQQQQQFRESSEVELEKGRVVSSRQSSEDVGQSKSCDISPGGRRMWSEASKAAGGDEQSKIPAVGDTVHVPSLGMQVVVSKVEEAKGEIIVQAGNMKLRLKLKDIQSQRTRTS
ncbi:hypothetical protein BHE74_00047389 [Ensete ventricosum]|nr:hypothetical protein BHE74_00047389 [Ensete ventricosum]RZR87553.1 hypothetical protein BHM03_00015001 [Ensete ventricosum]